MSRKQQLRSQVLHYFKAVGAGENMSQCIKQVLFMHQRFNPVQIFDKIAQGKQRISARRWRQYITGLNLLFTERQFKYFMKQNGFANQVTLNQQRLQLQFRFLESIIPYNGDVVRGYKLKCTDSIKIPQLNKEVEFIFGELVENQLKLIRTLINIRDEITAIAGEKDIQRLVQNDLLEHLEKTNQPREHLKLKQTFDKKQFKLGFSELRKFFKLWVTDKEIIHQLCMLNVMRHLKTHQPFSKIVFKKKRKQLINNNNKGSPQKRARSRSPNQQTPYGSEEKRSPQQSPYRKHLDNNYFGGGDDKYRQFKDQLINQFHNQAVRRQSREKDSYKQSTTKKRDSRQNSAQRQARDNRQQSYGQYQQQNLSPNSGYKRLQQPGSDIKPSGSKYNQNYVEPLAYTRPVQQQQTGIYNTKEMSLLLRLFQEILTKEQRLQSLRKDLAKHQDFNLINLYKLIDAKNKGFVTARDIQDWPDTEKAHYTHLVRFFGREDDRLYFNEFCQVFRPLSRQLNLDLDSRPENRNPDPFKRQTRRLIVEVLKLTAEEHLNLYTIRESLKYGDFKDLFALLDVYNRGYLDSDSLLTVFKTNQIYCDDKGLKCLMKMLRKRIDQRISYNDSIMKVVTDSTKYQKLIVGFSRDHQ